MFSSPGVHSVEVTIYGGRAGRDLEGQDLPAQRPARSAANQRPATAGANACWD